MNKLSVWKRKVAKERRRREQGIATLTKYSNAIREDLVKVGYYGPYKW